MNRELTAEMDKIIVAIHGVGSQSRNDTFRAVAHQFGKRCSPALPTMPLGYFDTDVEGGVALNQLVSEDDNQLADIFFSEVFWADIPDGMVKAGDTLEETKAWGHTVVGRAEAAYRRNVPGGNLKPADFQQGIGVVEEIVESIAVLDNLLAVAAKAGVFKFELGKLLRDYVDDVQVVADFPHYRHRIVARFKETVNRVLALHAERRPGRTAELYIVAHSEGTVVSFLAMLEALSGKGESNNWITAVRGYMTIGSPIDKHLALWPAMWEGLALGPNPDPGSVVAARPVLAQPIKWHNYYDYGDPIGFQLDGAEAFLAKQQCQAFDFSTEHNDHGFSRYYFPGKAHIDYWNDKEVFGHFIDTVVQPKEAPKLPADRPTAKLVCAVLPFALTFVLHLAAVFVLLKAAFGTMLEQHPLLDAHFAALVLAASAILWLSTVAARLPRLVRTQGYRWQLAAFALSAAAVACTMLVPRELADIMVMPLPWIGALVESAGLPRFQGVALPSIALLVGVGWFIGRGNRRGRHYLMWTGAAMIAGAIISRQQQALPPPIWPLLLGGLAALYLWWIGVMLFDLAFIWHRYIRQSVTNQTLSHWREHRDAAPGSAPVKDPVPAQGEVSA